MRVFVQYIRGVQRSLNITSWPTICENHPSVRHQICFRQKDNFDAQNMTRTKSFMTVTMAEGRRRRLLGQIVVGFSVDDSLALLDYDRIFLLATVSQTLQEIGVMDIKSRH